MGEVSFGITEALTFLLYYKLGFPDIIAVSIALVTATTAGYFLNRKYVARVKSGKFLIFLFIYAINIIFIDIFQYELFHTNAMLGILIASIIISPINYVAEMLKVWSVSLS